jgi:UDP-glucose 4-epimerase
MRILVTGAAGFAGSRIAHHLAYLGHDVIAGVRNTPPPYWLINAMGVDVMRIDLATIPNLPPVDGCVHCASTPSNCGTDEQITANGAPITANLLVALERAGCRHVVYLSSTSAFGNIQGLVLNEHTPIDKPDAYGASKLACESLLEAAVDAHTLDSALSLRLCGLIGPDAPRVWLSRVAGELRHNRPVMVYNANEFYNNAVHVHDLGKLCSRALSFHKPGHDWVVLAARGRSTPYVAVDTMAHAMGSRSVINVDDAPRPHFHIDCSKAIECHGYDPMDIGVMMARYGRECR